MVRLAKISEFPKIVAAGRKVWEENGLPGAYDDRHTLGSWTFFADSGYGFLVCDFSQSGEVLAAMGGVVLPDPFTGDSIATQLTWFVTPGCRGDALKVFKFWEREAVKRGAKRLSTHLLVSRLKPKSREMMERLGYRADYVAFIKEL